MKSLLKFSLIIALLGFPFCLNSQVKIDLKKKVITIDKNKAANAAKDVKKDQAPAKQDKPAAPSAPAANSQSQTDSGTKVVSDKPDAEKQPQLQTYSKYDFVAGEKVIFFDDFVQDNVGDFPVEWTTNGSGEVVTLNTQSGKWFKIKGANSRVVPEKIYTLPDNFTIEFDVIPERNSKGGDSNAHKWEFDLLNLTDINKSFYGTAYNGISFSFGHSALYNTMWANDPSTPHLGASNNDVIGRQEPGSRYHISVWVQKNRIRLYQNENKVWDLPRALSSTLKLNAWRFTGGEPMITNFRVAVGTPDMRNKLISEGKLVTYGIYFDVNKDVVKPESYGTLKEIANVLTENPTVRVKILGHTDSDGADEANLELSKRRGASVKNELITSFGIDASRLESDGMGETQPVASNDTPVNKALNRRVELVKL